MSITSIPQSKLHKLLNRYDVIFDLRQGSASAHRTIPPSQVLQVCRLVAEAWEDSDVEIVAIDFLPQASTYRSMAVDAKGYVLEEVIYLHQFVAADSAGVERFAHIRAERRSDGNYRCVAVCLPLEQAEM